MEKQLKTWSDFIRHLDSMTPQAQAQFIESEFVSSLKEVSACRNYRNVILYGSSWLQKAAPSNLVSITHEEINGLMAVVHGLDCSKGLSLILHTPGGTAPDSLVDYIRKKFGNNFEVIVPTYAMSAGTMICLGADRIIMGKQSQLGPIDPQMGFNGRPVSAFSILDQFDFAKSEIVNDPRTTNAWAHILAQFSPALLIQARNAIDFSEALVSNWLNSYMFKGNPSQATNACQHFSRGSDPGHKNHGRRINRDEALSQGLVIEELEADQDLQDAVMRAYHIMTISFEKSNATKMFINHNGSKWIKNIADNSR